jgi:5,10-methylenetetrahydromethanopterin reductase
MRIFLDEGQIDCRGEFYKYRGLSTLARPVQARLPLKIGALRGPRSFELAGEIADGMHTAVTYSCAALEFAASHVRIGAERAGRDWRTLDLGAWMATVISTDAAAAKQAARVAAAYYLPAMPDELLARHEIDRGSLQPIFDAFGRGDVKEAIALAPPEIADRLCLAGSPEEWIERIKRDTVPSGFTHLICGVIDPFLVEQWSGLKVAKVPDLRGQLRLIHDRVMPTFS